MTTSVIASGSATVSPQGQARSPARQSSQYLKDFLAYLTHERRLAANTAASYARDIAALIQMADAAPLDKLQVHQIRRYVAQLHGRGLDGRSISRMLSAWRGFYRYLARDRGFTANPCMGIRAPKAAKRLPHALSPDEASRLMNISEDDALALRDKAMFELFYSSGLRLSELTGLAPGDIDAADGTVRWNGGRARYLYVLDESAENPMLLFDTNMQGWGPDYIKRNPGVTMAQVEQFLTKMYKTPADFVWSVSRDFVKQCTNPVLILPDDIPAHPYKVAMEAAMLAPNAEVSLFPWKDPKERIPLAIRQIRSFLRAHRTA